MDKSETIPETSEDMVRLMYITYDVMIQKGSVLGLSVWLHSSYYK